MANENTEAASGTSAANNQVFIKSKPSEKFFYPLQGVGGSVFIWTFLSGFITMYYTNSVMIGAAAVGTMMLIARVLDGFTDIIMGIILEKTNWKMGKGRPWVLIGAPLVTIGLLMCFHVPAGFSYGQKIIYMYLTYIFIAAIAFTIYGVSMTTMFTRISTDTKDSGLLSSIFMTCSNVGATLMYVIAIPILYKNGINEQASWNKVVLIMAASAFICIVVGTLGCKEKVPQVDVKVEKVPVKTAFLATAKAPEFWILLVLFAASYVDSGLTSGGMLYYFTYVLQDINLQTVYSMGNMFFMIIPILLSNLIIRKVDKTKFLRVVLLLSVISGFARLIAPTNVYAYIALSWITQGLHAPVWSLMWVMLTDLVVYIAVKTGIRSEGFISMISSVGTKIGTGLGSALVGWLLATGKYDATAAVQGSSAIHAMIVMTIVLPSIMIFIEWLMTMFWKADQKTKELISAKAQ